MSYVQRVIQLFRKIVPVLMFMGLLTVALPAVASGSSASVTSATSTGGSSGSLGFGDMAEKINNILPDVTTLIASIAYLGGIAFAVMGILKFKQHKDSPQQVTLGVPIVMIFVAAALLFLPTMIKTTGTTITGGDDAIMGTPESSSGGIWNQ